MSDQPITLTGVDIVRDASPRAHLRANNDPDPDGDGDGDGVPAPGTMFGHFSVFNTWYEVHSFFEGDFIERIAPGAFRKTIAERRDAIKVTFNHGFDMLGDQVLGDIDDLHEDKTGPYYEVPLFRGVPELIVEGLRAGVYGSSFRFEVLGDTWDHEPDASDHNPAALPERTINEVRLHEFGPVTFPANPDATAQMRSATDTYYNQLRGRDEHTYDTLVARARELRTPAGPTQGATGAATPPPEPEQSATTPVGMTQAQRERALTLLALNI